jgi:hypothetical protein
MRRNQEIRHHVTRKYKNRLRLLLRKIDLRFLLMTLGLFETCLAYSILLYVGYAETVNRIQSTGISLQSSFTIATYYTYYDCWG